MELAFTVPSPIMTRPHHHTTPFAAALMGAVVALAIASNARAEGGPSSYDLEKVEDETLRYVSMWDGQSTWTLAYGACRRITNPGDDGLFVPLKTTEEWRSFLDNYDNVSHIEVDICAPQTVIKMCGEELELPFGLAGDEHTLEAGDSRFATFAFAASGTDPSDPSVTGHWELVDSGGKGAAPPPPARRPCS
jgi:hypothetical protein